MRIETCGLHWMSHGLWRWSCSALFFVRVCCSGTGGDPRFQRALIGVRVVALTLVLFLLLGPALVARKLEPGTHFVPVLYDDSRSMTIPENGRETRAERFVQVYQGSDFEARFGGISPGCAVSIWQHNSARQ